MGPQVLKGIAEPMQAFRVRRALGTERDAEKSLPDGGVFLVGREEATGILLRRWEQSKAGLDQIVLLSGEAGIGKSSLVSTIRRHGLAEGYTRITLRCSPYHTHSALYPVLAHVQRIGSLQGIVPCRYHRSPLARRQPLLARGAGGVPSPCCVLLWHAARAGAASPSVPAEKV